ncbi:MAG: hypothetical protein M1839_006951 [Geoglossum umbratile]|nr:MAG: hypothetical protein M1839_006951 [Geoglossum umbratile]
MADEQRTEDVPKDEANGPDYRSRVVSKPFMEKKAYQPKFSEGDKVYRKVARGGLEGPYTIDSVYGDEWKGVFWYTIKGATLLSPLEKVEQVDERDLQRKPK